MNGVKVCGSLIVLLIGSMFVSAQELPWSVQQTSNRHYISFEINTPLINGEPLEEGDFIGVFYDSAANFHCAGYLKWGYGEPLLIAYGQDDRNPGFEKGQKLHYRVWKSDENCVAPVNQVGYQPNNNFPDRGDFKQGGKSRIGEQAFFAHIISVNYWKSSYCQAEGQASPIISAFKDSIQFSTESNGLELDPNSGTIDLAASDPGYYQIKLSAHFCLNREQLPIKILPSSPLSLRDSVSICPGDTAILKPSADYIRYYWSTGDTSRKLKVTKPGIYSIQAVTPQECFVADTIHVIQKDPANLNLPSNKSGCGSVNVSIDSAAESSEFLWSSGETKPQVNFTESGEYWVRMETGNGCVAYDTIQVRVSPVLQMEERNITVNHAACDARGSIEMQGNALTGGIPPFEYHLKDVIEGSTIKASDQTINDLKPGEYELTVEDSMGCRQTLRSPLRITHKDCENPVIAPNEDQANSYYFDQAGQIEIYDRYGQLVKTLKGPAEWHARNEAGRQVQMGSYTVLIDGKKKLQITVVR